MGLSDQEDSHIPAYRIVANDADITATIDDRFMWLRITDEAGLQADTLELCLADHDPEKPIQIPSTGAELEVFLGYGNAVQRMGMFVCDEIELSGWPGVMTIRARASVYEATPKGKTDLQTQKARSWPNNIKLGAMVAKIAKEHGMEPAVAQSLKNIVLPHFDQTEESDISFLLRILRNYDAIVKPANGKLIVAKRGESKSASGEDLPIVTVEAEETTTFHMNISARESPGTVVAYWHSTKRGKKQEIKVGSGDPVRRIRHYYPSADAAIQAAQSELNKRMRRKNKVSLTMPGHSSLMAESRLQLNGFREGVAGEWLVTRVEHELGHGGYACRVEAEKPIEIE